VQVLARQYPDPCVSTAGVHSHDAKDFFWDDLDRHATQHYAPLDSQGGFGKLKFCIALPVNEHSIRSMKIS
jgi:hypothetical protein